MPLDLANVDWMVSSANKCLQVLLIRHRGLFSINFGFNILCLCVHKCRVCLDSPMPW